MPDDEPGGFYVLYSIDTGNGNDPTESPRAADRVTGLNSPWGNRGELLRNFGWTYEYLLWGISWLNVSLMIADAPRTKELPKDEFGNEIDTSKVVTQNLSTKEDIKNYIKGLM